MGAPFEVTGTELSTILAALRAWQVVLNDQDTSTRDALMDIATNGGASRPLDLAEIDALCERLNGGQAW